MTSAQTRRVIAAGVIGNVLEWYDFAIYGYFASAIGRQFFPHEDAVAQLLSVFSIFALGYLMRVEIPCCFAAVHSGCGHNATGSYGRYWRHCDIDGHAS
jgi:hypothetical protein